jgi:hypothetical protein
VSLTLSGATRLVRLYCDITNDSKNGGETRQDFRVATGRNDVFRNRPFRPPVEMK